MSIPATAGHAYEKPLILTPLIKAGKLDEAKQLAQVKELPNAPQVDSFSGFLTVNEQYESNLFFWFFRNENPEAPILLWLQGGPGASSLLGLFYLHGPFVINKAGDEATLREFAWTKEYHVLYIDQPAGTGYSFTKEAEGLVTNQSQVASQLYEALDQFFTLFAEYQSNHFYITGESYAGKYVPAIGYKIHTEGEKAKMNLKGIAIGNGYVDPVTQWDFASFLYWLGMLDEKEATFFQSQQEKIIALINEGDFEGAQLIGDDLMDGDFNGGDTYFLKFTGLKNYLNFRLTSSPEDQAYYKSYVTLPEVRNAIHVGDLTLHDCKAVELAMKDDLMRSVKPWLEVLMDNYKVMLYNGQLDICCAAPLTDKMIKTLDWKGALGFANCKKKVWRVEESDAEVAGYVRKFGSFQFAIVRNAGHFVPYDQPRVGFHLIKNFIEDEF